MNAAAYDNRFYDYNDAVATRSARVAVPIVASLVPRVRSVADFGCGRGAWLGIWLETGVDTVAGVDGGYVDTDRLLIGRDCFRAADLSKPIDLGRRFDLVQSLEVAEHIPAASADAFVETLTRHSGTVFFSAAPPGQGGESHVNEQPYGYWRARFADRGYALFDCIRPRLSGHKDAVQPWYLYNTFLYVREDRVEGLAPALRETRIQPDAEIPDISPLGYRIRKRVVRSLPRPVQDKLARLAARRFAA